MELSKLATDIEVVLEELIAEAKPSKEQILVVGCSTSEVIGKKIGTIGSMEVAETLIATIQRVTATHGLYFAMQCCEHLNRALVVEKSTFEKYNLEEVTVVPVQHAGGAMAATAYKMFKEPVMVNAISAHVGLDIGQTLVGMHLKRVAVPVRLSVNKIGDAIITAARTRPPLIGGERAQYSNLEG